MKNLKALVILAIAGLSLAGFASSASAATALTDGNGVTLGVGSPIQGELTGVMKVTNTFGPPIECEGSNFNGIVTNQGGATSTPVISLTVFSLTKCNCEVVTWTKGTLEVHTEAAMANNNGTVTASGFQFTTNNCTSRHCMWVLKNAHFGKLTGGTPATLTVNAGLMNVGASPHGGGKSGAFCGNHATWTATYKITEPGTLLVH